MTTLFIILIALIAIFTGCVIASFYHKDYYGEGYTAGKVISVILFVILGSAYLWNITAYRDIPELQKTAPAYVESLGYKSIEYIGFNGRPVWGGFVYYQARDTNDYLYLIAIADWRGELMLETLECLNAVSSKPAE